MTFKIGDRVCMKTFRASRGTIEAIHDSVAFVRWDNSGATSHVHFDWLELEAN